MTSNQQETDPMFDAMMRKSRPKTDTKTFEEFLKKQTKEVLKGTLARKRQQRPQTQ